jgi:GGDEF domain-containing protein
MLTDDPYKITQTSWSSRWEDPWREHWAGRLRGALDAGAVALQRLLRLPEHTVGVIPAVYFTRLRMGSVPFFLWEERTEDVRLAFPWKPDCIPPPFTCFATPLGSTTEAWFGLIARVASLADSFIAGDDSVAELSDAEELRGLRVGVVSWENEEGGTIVADEWMLREFGIARTTNIFLLPTSPSWMPYVPLLYFQSTERYDTERARAILLSALRTSSLTTNDASVSADYLDVRRAVLAAANAAHVRAREWLNQKTQLLNRAGFEGLKDDLQWRIASGAAYAEIFFDIDNFKAANDAFTYDGADLLAAGMTDRVVAYVQREVARSYAHAAAFRRATGRYESLAPDSFRALIAHVSGDEFRVFLRAHPPIESDSFYEATPQAFAAGLVDAVAAPLDDIERVPYGDDTLAARHAAALRQNSAARRALTGRLKMDQRVLATPVTISAGLALPAPFLASGGSASSKALSSARAVLNSLDATSESVAGTAKRAGRNCVVTASIVRPRE